MTGEHGPELLGAIGVDRGSKRVLRARRDRARHGAAAQRSRETLRSRPAIVDGDREHRQPERGREVDDPRVAGILHSDSIAGAQVGLERELDAVERTAHHRHVVAGHAVAVEACSGKREQLRVRTGCAVEHRLMRQRD